jgi:hypothetical protein
MTEVLSPAQKRLLERAAAGGDQAITVEPEARRTASALVKRGLLVTSGEGFSITSAGRAAVGVADNDKAPAASEGSTHKPPRPDSKAAKVIYLLGQPEGTTVAQLSEATGWLPHSVRGFMAGALKKKHGVLLASEPAEGGRVYRIALEQAAA